eukprot:gb/GFBE01055305.1/.p1 GENE.gb/GFBE01055305.1/~~gb/GFBE01055305.1/.p1  ORF type:complete len:371 (+),score=54.92 gb/GFBE01055305.1/:1-1113(+)
MSRSRPKSAGRVRSVPGPTQSFGDQEQRLIAAYGAPLELLAEHAAAGRHPQPQPFAPPAAFEAPPPPLHAPRGARGSPDAAPTAAARKAPAAEVQPSQPSQPSQLPQRRGNGVPPPSMFASAAQLKSPSGSLAPEVELRLPQQRPAIDTDVLDSPGVPGSGRGGRPSPSPSPLASHRENRQRSGTSQPPRARGGAAEKAKKAAAARARNPFIEYDDREKRLSRERKWLQEDSTYLNGRKQELKHGTLMNHLNIASDSKQDLYDKRTFYGPYSMALKASKQRAQSAGRQRPQSACPAEVGRHRPVKEDRSAAVTMKKLAQELRNSCSRETQRGFEKAVARSQGTFLEDTPRESNLMQDMKLLGFRGIGVMA